jgi:DNA-binding MarR family transcriptional regulator
MAELDLKSPHVSCLYYLYKADSLTSKELCDICEEDKANISRTVKYLVDNGYVIRVKGGKSGRYARLALTERGIEVGEFLSEQIERIISIVSDGIDDDTLDLMYSSLGTIEKRLGRLCEG